MSILIILQHRSW